MSKDISKNDVEVIKSALAHEVKTQPASLLHVNRENGTIGAFFSEYPNIHKNTTDRMAKHGWKISGISQDNTEKATVNVYFRPINE